MSGHRHWFSALWSNFGPYGPQDVHYHPCLHEAADGEYDCQRVVIGPGRECSGTEGHARMTLTENGPRERGATGG